MSPRRSRTRTLSEAAGASELPPGTLLDGKYRVVRKLGSGGMGVVYLVEDEKLARPFAAKTFARIGGTEDERRRRGDRFAAEARAQANIRHDHIVRVVASGFDDALGVDFFVMDAVLVTQAALEALCRDVLRCAPPADAGDGPRAVSLEDLLAGGKTLGEAETVRILREQLGAVAAAHAHTPAVVHRDIKPSNILLDGDGRSWLTDFGIAKTEGDADFSLTGFSPLTRSYASPEQLRGVAPVTFKSDYYSLGLVAFRMLAGGLQGASAKAIPADLEKSLSRKWNPLFKGLLADDPDARLADPRKIAALLDAIERDVRRHRGGEKKSWFSLDDIGYVIMFAVAFWFYDILTDRRKHQDEPHDKTPPSVEAPAPPSVDPVAQFISLPESTDTGAPALDVEPVSEYPPSADSPTSPEPALSVPEVLARDAEVVPEESPTDAVPESSPDVDSPTQPEVAPFGPDVLVPDGESAPEEPPVAVAPELPSDAAVTPSAAPVEARTPWADHLPLLPPEYARLPVVPLADAPNHRDTPCIVYAGSSDVEMPYPGMAPNQVLWMDGGRLLFRISKARRQAVMDRWGEASARWRADRMAGRGSASDPPPPRYDDAVVTSALLVGPRTATLIAEAQVRPVFAARVDGVPDANGRKPRLRMAVHAPHENPVAPEMNVGADVAPGVRFEQGVSDGVVQELRNLTTHWYTGDVNDRDLWHRF